MPQGDISRSCLGKLLLKRLDLAGQLIDHAGTDAGLQDDAEQGSHLRFRRVDGSLQRVHDVVPLTLGRGEHRSVRLGRALERTTCTAGATAPETPSPTPSGVAENATIMTDFPPVSRGADPREHVDRT